MLDVESVRLAPIEGTDLSEVGAFLHAHRNRRLSAARWTASIVPTWPVDAPNHGFLLRDAERIVGVQLAFYSERTLHDGTVVDVCNLGASCVLRGYRSHGVRLLRAALAQRHYLFIDLSPSGEVVGLNRRLGFEDLDASTALLPHSPMAPTRGVRIVSDHGEIGSLLDGRDLVIFRDHQAAAASRHLLLVRGLERCYVVVRTERRRHLPVFASYLHVGNPGLLRGHLPRLGRHLLVHHGLAASLVEVRLLGRRPSASILLRAPSPKMFRNPHGACVPAAAIDNLYSELALVPW